MKISQVLKAGAIAGGLCFLSLSCTGSVNPFSPSTTANANDSEENIVYGELIFPENSDYLIIPVGFSQDYRKIGGSVLPTTDYSRGSESVRGKPMMMYNMIFHHKQKAESHLLLSKNSIISAFNFISLPSDEEAKAEQQVLETQFILLEIISEDTNNDEKLDRKDAIVAYLADASGKNVTQITPSNTKVVSWHLDKNQGFLLFKVIQDSDQNKEFSAVDDTSFIRVNLKDIKIGSDIITEPMRQQINQKLYSN